MPEHIHLIIEINTIKSMSDFLRNFKSYTSKEIKKILRSAARRRTLRERNKMQSLNRPKKMISKHIWQRGTMDHLIRNEKDYENHINETSKYKTKRL